MSLLDTRAATHGDFATTCAAYAGPDDNLFAYPYDMIRAKLARIASGDPMTRDHWADIIGYAEGALRLIDAAAFNPYAPPADEVQREK